MKPLTAVSLFRLIVQDGYLSESNAARAQEMLASAEAGSTEVPQGQWSDEVVGLRHVDGGEFRPSVRTHLDTVYLASDVHRVLNLMGALLGAAEIKLAALQAYHSGPAAQAIDTLCTKLRDGGVALPIL